MKDTPIIRKAVLGDAAEVSRLAIELGYHSSQEDIERRLVKLRDSERHLIAVAVANEPNLAGWIAAEARLILESGEYVELVGLVVDSRARGRGIGWALVRRVEHWAREMGVSRVVARSNIVRGESHDFFQGIGYAKRKTQHHYRKELASA